MIQAVFDVERKVPLIFPVLESLENLSRNTSKLKPIMAVAIKLRTKKIEISKSFWKKARPSSDTNSMHNNPKVVLKLPNFLKILGTNMKAPMVKAEEIV
jgi:hypothetical protein